MGVLQSSSGALQAAIEQSNENERQFESVSVRLCSSGVGRRGRPTQEEVAHGGRLVLRRKRNWRHQEDGGDKKNPQEISM